MRVMLPSLPNVSNAIKNETRNQIEILFHFNLSKIDLK